MDSATVSDVMSGAELSSPTVSENDAADSATPTNTKPLATSAPVASFFNDAFDR